MQPSSPFGLLDVHGDGSQIDESHQALEPALVERVRAQARLLTVSVATLFHAALGAGGVAQPAGGMMWCMGRCCWVVCKEAQEHNGYSECSLTHCR